MTDDPGTTNATGPGYPHQHPGPTRGPELVVLAMVAQDGVIGNGIDQPWHLREDQKRFRALSIGHPTIMGRRTFEAIGRPLPGRPAVVLTRDPHWRRDDVQVARSFPQAVQTAAALPGGESVMVIGGAAVYAEALPLAHRLELTLVDADAPTMSGSRVCFPPLDPTVWCESSRDDRWAFAFVTFRRCDDVQERA